MRNRIVTAIMFFSLLTSAAVANATSISYTANNNGGSAWEYEYTVYNDTLSTNIDEFTVFFDYGLYSNLAVTASPADWDSITIEPQLILGFPENGFFDSLALVAGIAPGDTLGGFRVSFDWLGTGTPGAQSFDVIDPVEFVQIDSGITTAPAPAAASVPEPGTLLLVSAGSLGLAFARKRLMI